MAKTAAERQREYRQRRALANNGDGDWRLNTWISSSAVLALRRLAAYHGVTQKAMLEQLLIDAQEAVTAGMDLDSPEWERFFSVTQ